MGNNIALVIYSLYMSLLLRGTFYALGWESIARNGSVAIETAVSTVIIIFFAEFLPKSVFRNNPNFYYRALAPVIYFFYLLLYPIARAATTLISHGILRLTGRRVEERTTTHSFDREDLASLLDTNSSEPRPEPDNELKLFQNALDFADLRVRDCMVPRVDVEAVDIDDTTIEQLTARFVDSKYSRIFVWRKSIDNIIGYINSKSLFTRPAGISDVMMQVNFVPETMPLQAGAAELYQAPHQHRRGDRRVRRHGGRHFARRRAGTDFRRDRGRARRARPDRKAGRSRRVCPLVPSRSEIPQ